MDTGTNPICMDLKSLEKGRLGATDEANFKFDRDTLRIRFYLGEGKKRPSSFAMPGTRESSWWR